MLALLEDVARGEVALSPGLVGAKLNLSERTIKYHMGEIVGRLHLESRAQAIEYARRAGMVG